MSTISSRPASFRKVLLTLASEPGHPIGDRGIGYEIVAPLNAAGRIDAELWRAHPDLCRVTRFRRNEKEKFGHLMRCTDGSWTIHYELTQSQADEAGSYFVEQGFGAGQRVTITENSVQHTYEVLSVRAL